MIENEKADCYQRNEYSKQRRACTISGIQRFNVPDKTESVPGCDSLISVLVLLHLNA
jgi:murein tripeptide amidase MpaA